MTHKKDFVTRSLEIGSEAQQFQLLEDPVFRRLVDLRGTPEIKNRVANATRTQHDGNDISLHVLRAMVTDVADKAAKELLYPYDTSDVLRQATDADPVLSTALQKFGTARRLWMDNPDDSDVTAAYLDTANFFEGLQRAHGLPLIAEDSSKGAAG